MGIWQVILTLLFYVLMALVLWLLWAIWRDSTKRMQRLEQALADATLRTAAAAERAAEAAYLLAKERPP
jgi:hypothetical protein